MVSSLLAHSCSLSCRFPQLGLPPPTSAWRTLWPGAPTMCPQPAWLSLPSSQGGCCLELAICNSIQCSPPATPQHSPSSAPSYMTFSCFTAFLNFLRVLCVVCLHIWALSWGPCLPGSLIQGSVQFSCSVVSDSLQPHGLQHARLPCPSPTPGACSNSCPSSR